jgi:SAM-dependent methyltransferase
LNRLFDVGCSAGAFLAAARKEGWQATGVEISVGCARAGRERHGLDIRVGTLRESSFPGEYFDVVRMNNLLEHLPDPMADLLEACRVLRDGGLLALATINGRSLAAWLSGSAWRYYDPFCHVYVFTPSTLGRMLSRSGFGSARIRTHGFRWGSSPHRAGKVLALIARAAGLGHRMRATAVKVAVSSKL